MRLPRLDWPGAKHHVMNRGTHRSDIFPHEESRDAFLHLLGQLPQRFDVRVHGYALMPDHYHLMLESVSGQLSRAMQRLASEYTQQVNVMMGWEGALFRGRFRNRVVETDDYWRHLLAYVHLNPGRAGLAGLDDPSWTSHAIYAGVAECPDWLTTTELQTLHGSPADYVAYLNESASDKVVAAADFDPKMLWTRGKTGVVAGPPSLEPYLEISEALAQVCRVTGLDLDAVLERRRGRSPNQASWLAAWWMSRRCAISSGRIKDAFGTGHVTVSRWIRRVEERRHTDPVLKDWIDRLERGEGKA